MEPRFLWTGVCLSTKKIQLANAERENGVSEKIPNLIQNIQNQKAVKYLAQKGCLFLLRLLTDLFLNFMTLIRRAAPFFIQKISDVAKIIQFNVQM